MTYQYVFGLHSVGNYTQGFSLLSQFTLAWHTDRQTGNPNFVAFALQSWGLLQTEWLFVCGSVSTEPPCDSQMGNSQIAGLQGVVWAKRNHKLKDSGAGATGFLPQTWKELPVRKHTSILFFFPDDQHDIGKEKQFSFS